MSVVSRGGGGGGGGMVVDVTELQRVQPLITDLKVTS